MGAHIATYVSAGAAGGDSGPLFTCAGQRTSSKEVAARVAALAAAFSTRLGLEVTKGTRPSWSREPVCFRIP